VRKWHEGHIGVTIVICKNGKQHGGGNYGVDSDNRWVNNVAFPGAANEFFDADCFPWQEE
jgi:hypothetical protein